MTIHSLHKHLLRFALSLILYKVLHVKRKNEKTVLALKELARDFVL